jgi:hypothetical protein
MIAEAAVVATRDVKSSTGTVEHRPVVHATVVLAGRLVTAEVTLTRRDEMGFRMLVGREALRHRFVVDPGVSYLGGRPAKAVRRRNRGETATTKRPASTTRSSAPKRSSTTPASDAPVPPTPTSERTR